jgi:hypothetical protein
VRLFSGLENVLLVEIGDILKGCCHPRAILDHKHHRLQSDLVVIVWPIVPATARGHQAPTWRVGGIAVSIFISQRSSSRISCTCPGGCRNLGMRC